MFCQAIPVRFLLIGTVTAICLVKSNRVGLYRRFWSEIRIFGSGLPTAPHPIFLGVPPPPPPPLWSGFSFFFSLALYEHGCHRSGNFESEKIEVIYLIPLTTGYSIVILLIFVTFFLNKEGTFFENLRAFMNGWKRQLQVEVRSLYNMTFCFVLDVGI